MKRILILLSLLLTSVTIFAQQYNSDGVDGRFAFGMDGQQILYGYPNSQPTSYFMIRVEKPGGGYVYGSNKKDTPQKVNALKSVAELIVRDGVQVQQNRFRFSAFDILQEIIPLNNFDQPALAGEVIRKYRVDYRISNYTDQDFSMGFAQFLDFKIGDNDACRMEFQQQRVEESTIIEPHKESCTVKLYQKDFDKQGFAGELELVSGLLERPMPARLYFGDYRDLGSKIWGWKLSRTKYLDAAMVLEWDDLIVSAGQTTVNSFHLGIPAFVKGNLEVSESLLFETTDFINHSLFFKLGVSQLTSEQKSTLRNLLEKKSIERIIINGFSDKVGSAKQCQLVSAQRAKAVKTYLEQSLDINIPYEINAFGSSRAGVLKEDQQKTGNEKDRKVDLLIELR